VTLYDFSEVYDHIDVWSDSHVQNEFLVGRVVLSSGSRLKSGTEWDFSDVHSPNAVVSVGRFAANVTARGSRGRDRTRASKYYDRSDVYESN